MDSNNQTLTTIGVILAIICISYIAAKLIQYIEKERAASIINESHYIDARNKFMDNVFNGGQYYQKIEVSADLEKNFINAKSLDYLIKYFDMEINDKTVDNLTEFCTEINKIYASASEISLDKKYIDQYLPVFIMSYTSPGRKIHRESYIRFNPDTIEKAKKKIEKKIASVNKHK